LPWRACPAWLVLAASFAGVLEVACLFAGFFRAALPGVCAPVEAAKARTRQSTLPEARGSLAQLLKGTSSLINDFTYDAGGFARG